MNECFRDYEIDTNACLVFVYTWRRREILEECISSMVRQPGYPLRIWALDNGNNDGSREYLLSQVYEGHIEKLIIEKRNWGIWHALNQWRALMRTTSYVPNIREPKYCMLTNDDMIVCKDDWLAICVQSFEELRRSPFKVGILSPFHCRHLNGEYAYGTAPETYWHGYPISTYVSGNTWFMDTMTFLSMPNFPTTHLTEGGDWFMLEQFKLAGYKCARTREELIYQHPETQGEGRYNYLKHW